MTPVFEGIKGLISIGRWGLLLFIPFFGIAFSFQPPPLEISEYVANSASFIAPNHAQAARALEWMALCVVISSLSIIVFHEVPAILCWIFNIRIDRFYMPFLLGILFWLVGLSSITLAINRVVASGAVSLSLVNTHSLFTYGLISYGAAMLSVFGCEYELWRITVKK